MGEKRVIVAMSGGIDSALAAALLKEAGYQIGAVHLQLYSGHDLSGLEETCRILDIPLDVLDFRTDFERLVIDRFCSEYKRGRTPNPCVLCNQYIKFGLLLERVLGMGADYMATGHYARIESTPGGYRLLRAVDDTKEQSYFLYTLGQRQLGSLLFPLGSMRKTEVREMVSALGLPVRHQAESQDVCFLAGGDYRSFISGRVCLDPGDIIDSEGAVLGQHEGLVGYTVGQRQGLGLALGERRYVLGLDAATNRVIVGGREELFGSCLRAGGLRWVTGRAPATLTGITAKIRYRAPEAAVDLVFDEAIVRVDFSEPQWAIAPGQAVVFYRGEEVLGGGIIETGG